VDELEFKLDWLLTLDVFSKQLFAIVYIWPGITMATSLVPSDDEAIPFHFLSEPF
jgi:hypothetical protein